MEAIRKSSNTSNGVIVAIRIQDGFESCLVQRSDHHLYLVEKPCKPGGREVVTALTNRQALDWLSYHPARKRGDATAERERNRRLLAGNAAPREKRRHENEALA